MSKEKNKGIKARMGAMAGEILRDAGFVKGKPQSSGSATPEAASQKKPSIWKIKFGQKSVNAQQLSDFFDQLGTLIASGIPMLQTLDFARAAIKHERLNEALVRIAQDVREGASFSEAMGKHPDLFDHVLLECANHSNNKWSAAILTSAFSWILWLVKRAAPNTRSEPVMPTERIINAINVSKRSVPFWLA